MIRSARILVMTGLVAASLGVATPAQAATISVNTLTDEWNTGNSTCSLREAAYSANNDTAAPGCTGGSGADVISLMAGTHDLSRPLAGGPDIETGDIALTDGATLQPAGTGAVVIDANGINDRVFEVLGPITVTFRNITIASGSTPSLGGGGIRLAPGSTVEVLGSTLRDNLAGSGGAIYANAGTLTVRNSTLSGNKAIFEGGALSGDNSQVTTLSNVTITNNEADSDADGSGDGGGIRESGNSYAVRNTIIAGNRDLSPTPADQHPDCYMPTAGGVVSQGYNLVQIPKTCTGFTAAGDITGQAPNLGSLQDNGGPTPTHELLIGSPAIDAGNPATPGSGGAACEATDQRGVTRPQGTRCDIGAFERVPPPAIPGGRCAGRSATHQGTDLNDVVTGTEGDDVFVGLNGADTFKGLGGNDIACGGSGNDKLKGGGGADRLNGQGGNDRLAGQGGRDVLKGGGDNDRMSGGGGRDSCLGGGGRDRGSACEGTRSLP